MRKNLRLYTGGEDDFCHRFSRAPDDTFVDFGVLDRRKLKALNVEPVLSEAPIVIEEHAITTGVVPRTSIEHVLPNSWVEYGVKDGVGCDAQAYMNHHFRADELAGKLQPDQHWHEHATCFRLGDRGLIVISSCGHAGIVNTLKRAQEVSVEKIYALVGGFHLAPAPEAYLRQVMAELNKFNFEHIMPMHCSGQNFVDLAQKEMPEKLVLCGTGSSFTFTAWLGSAAGGLGRLPGSATHNLEAWTPGIGNGRCPPIRAFRIQQWKSTAVDPQPSSNHADKLAARVVTRSAPW